MFPRTLDEAEAVVRETAGARVTDAVPRDYPDRQIVAVCQIVAAMLDDLRRVPIGEGANDGR